MTQIAAFGANWFRSLGTPAEPGTRLVTITGAVRQPGVVEAPVGTPLLALLERAGGPTETLSAALVGGFYGTWVSPRAFGAYFSQAGLAPHGASAGAGVIVALPASACGLTETARALAWFAAESAGQCGPCVFGLADIANGFGHFAAGKSGHCDTASPTRQARPDLCTIVRWARDIEGRGACRHPDGAVRLLKSALDVFADDVARHLSGEACQGGERQILAVPAPPRTWR